MKSLPRILIIHLKRFDENGKKLNYDVDCPTEFSFPSQFLTEDLAQKEKTGYTGLGDID